MKLQRQPDGNLQLCANTYVWEEAKEGGRASLEVFVEALRVVQGGVAYPRHQKAEYLEKALAAVVTLDG